jgi:hypothetical protein
MATIPLYEPPPRNTFLGSLAAFGTRRLLGVARWRARREIRAQMRPSQQAFRGFIQINLIRLH